MEKHAAGEEPVREPQRAARAGPGDLPGERPKRSHVRNSSCRSVDGGAVLADLAAEPLSGRMLPILTMERPKSQRKRWGLAL